MTHRANESPTPANYGYVQNMRRVSSSLPSPYQDPPGRCFEEAEGRTFGERLVKSGLR